jgi:hypothetical protein
MLPLGQLDEKNCFHSTEKNFNINIDGRALLTKRRNCDKPREDMNSYRGIAVSNSLLNLLERTLYARVFSQTEAVRHLKDQGLTLISYADDTALACRDLEILKKAISSLIVYFKERNLILNLDKCELMRFNKTGKGR